MSGTIQQTGSVTPGHLVSWTTSGVVQDAGPSTSGQVNSLGLYGLGGTPYLITNSPTPGPFTGQYSQLGMGISLSAAYLTVNSFNGAPALPLNVVINGTTVMSLTTTGPSFSVPIGYGSGGTGLSAAPTNGQLLIGNGAGYALSTLTAGANIAISNTAGGVTISAVGGGGILPVVNGGTGLATLPSASQLLVGNGTGYALSTLTAGANIAITNAGGVLTVSATGSPVLPAVTFDVRTTVAVLRSITTIIEPAVYVEGYRFLADGGEGPFVYNSADTTSPDNGGTIIVDAAGHRWYRLLADVPISVKCFGAYGDNVHDDTAAIQATINFVQSRPSGIVFIPSGAYLLNGTLAITSSGLILQGESEYGTVLNFANGAADCIQMGAQPAAIQGVMIRDMSLHGVGKTGGWMINASVFSNAEFSDINITGAKNGIQVAQLNNVLIQNTVVILQVAGGYAGIAWVSPATALGRSDLLTIRDTVVQCSGLGANGIYVNGMCQTLRISNCGIIHSSTGLLIANSAASATYYPAFIFCDDLEIDGVDVTALQISGGREMHFVNCDFFNAGGNGADYDCVTIFADGSASVTNAIWFSGCRIAGARQRGVYCEAKQVDFTGCYIGDNSVAGSNLWPGVQLGNNGGANGAAVGVSFVGGRIGNVFGDLTNQNYGVVVPAGCSRINIAGVDFSSNVTGAILDNTGGPGNITSAACSDINGSPLPMRLPVVSVAPTVAVEGLMWVNVTTHTLNIFLNGVARTVTVT